MKTTDQQQTCETVTGTIRIFAESVIKAYEEHGFTPTTRDGDAEKRVLNPMSAVAYDLMVKNHPEDERMTLAEVIVAIAENSIEDMEYFFGTIMTPEYHDGFHVGVQGVRSNNPYSGEFAGLYTVGYEDGLMVRKALLDARKVIICPVCGPDGEWVYVNLPNRTRVDGSHAWCCDTCAIIAYEYNDQNDTLALDQYLDPSKMDCRHETAQSVDLDGMTDSQMQQYLESKGHKLRNPIEDNGVVNQALARLAVQNGFEWNAERELWFSKSKAKAPLGFTNRRPQNGELRVWYMDNGQKVAYLVPLLTSGVERIAGLMKEFGLTPKEAQGRMGLEIFLAPDDLLLLTPHQIETYWLEWGSELGNIHHHMTAPELTHMGGDRFIFLTNRIGEETGRECLYTTVPNEQGGTSMVPTPEFEKEATWWQRFSGLDTYYVIHKLTGKRGAAYCEEFVYDDIEDDDDAAEAKEHELGNSENVFAMLQIKSMKIREQYPDVEVTLGYQTGPNGRHELYAFAPYGTPGTEIFKTIDNIVFS